MVGDHASSLSLLTAFSLPPLMGVEVTNSLSVAASDERLWTQSLSEPGLVLNLEATLPDGAETKAESGLTAAMGAGTPPREAWSGDDMDTELSGRLRKMEGEKVRLREDLSWASGERNPVLRGPWGGLDGPEVATTTGSS